MSDEEKLQCAVEAIAAHGDNAKIEAWYARWMPDYLARWGITTVQYSASVALMKHAHRLLVEGPVDV